MPTFIENCNCKGVRPSGIVGKKHNLRPSLTGRLLNDRHCARYIVAPGGFGKSSLAYEYAQIVFEFKHVFWIRCDSPCFIRDLDAGTLVESVFASDEGARLVVFDDVPQLDASRTQAFDEAVEAILKTDCEVIACCTPANDSISFSHPDSIQIRAKDLLLNDEEVEIERMRGCDISDFDANGKQWRIASFVWSEGSNRHVVAGMSQEGLPLSLKSAMFAMLALGEGEMGDLARFLRPSAFGDDLAYLAEEYPYLGINLGDDSYQTIEVEISDIVKGMGAEIEAFSSGFVENATPDMASAFADALVEMGACGRGADFMRAYGKGDVRHKWVARNGWSLAFLPDPLPLLEIVEDCLAKNGRLSCDICTVAAWSAHILGDEGSAKSYCMKAYRGAPLGWQGRDACDLVSMIVDGALFDSGNVPARAQWPLCDMPFDEGEPSYALRDAPLDWTLACKLERALLEGNDAFAKEWKDAASATGPQNDDLFTSRTLMFSGTLFLRKVLQEGLSDSAEDVIWETIELIAEHAIPLIAATGTEDMGWPEYLAVKAIEECADRFPFRFASSLRVSDVAAMRRVDMRLFDQAGKWRARFEDSRRRKGEFELTHPDVFRKSSMRPAELSALRAATPTLSIVLFGGLYCWIGEHKEDMRPITREKAKSLLAIIALNHGREVSREKLVNMLWPNANFESANKNLYVVWSFLKRSLSIGDSCPYLLRTQNGFRLDTRYVSCDLSEFEELCRALLFGRNDAVLWEEMYEKVSGPFSEDLLPSLANNQTIDDARKMYRDQLVDGLVAASNRLYLQDEVRGAMWYAREAKRRDPSREDVYIALMAAQIASDQRANALDTYFECRKFLSDNMGIDPSAKVMELYRSIIEEEHEF